MENYAGIMKKSSGELHSLEKLPILYSYELPSNKPTLI